MGGYHSAQPEPQTPPKKSGTFTEKLINNHIVQYACEVQSALELACVGDWVSGLKNYKFLIHVPIPQYERDCAHSMGPDFFRLVTNLVIENVDLDIVCGNLGKIISEQITYNKFDVTDIRCQNVGIISDLYCIGEIDYSGANKEIVKVLSEASVQYAKFKEEYPESTLDLSDDFEHVSEVYKDNRAVIVSIIHKLSKCDPGRDHELRTIIDDVFHCISEWENMKKDMITFAVSITTDAKIAHLYDPPADYLEKLHEYYYHKCVPATYDFDVLLPTLGTGFLRGDMIKCCPWDEELFGSESVEVGELIKFYSDMYDVDIYFTNHNDPMLRTVTKNLTPVQRTITAAVNEAVNARLKNNNEVPWIWDIQGKNPIRMNIQVILHFDGETTTIVGTYIKLMPRLNQQLTYDVLSFDGY